ncbi:alpha/beta fold hydrolase [Tropicibacter naphthalenivorans]|uniref:3-oxoadipate enol-lactonase 2 n=1 Tax=Tropicibacter naphthalenivorans TaxID=441103 RepID=A0A0P1GH39_9RHOB|nr:alpha/beta fold hydrolase [Tropicibacter naphthalenivorans]CUH80982.1 3-oxoadipate enol-lactonase 2 [Tropicibacter naphthalenivorans]SMC91570.1 3-oxoadipate enol-lactonase [Tropicibacter naphthalenivorans]
MTVFQVTLPDGGHLNAALDGPEDAEVIVFANSVMTDLGVWDAQVAAFGATHRVLRFDQRGHGGSSLPDGPMRFEQYGADIIALLDHLDIKRCTFVGLSMGVPSGLAAHAIDPARFARFVVVDGICKSAPARVAFWTERRETALAQGMQVIAEQTAKNWLPGVATHDPKAAQLRAMIAATPAGGFAAATHALASYDLSAVVETLTCPLLGLAGALDGAMPSAVPAQFAAAPDARFATVPQAGHIPNYQAPEAFNAALADFLAATTPQKETI